MKPKERAHLRALANGIDTVLQIGKEGIGENLIHQAEITLQARELIKGRVLDTCLDYTPRTAAEALAEATHSEVVQVIGSKFVLYRKRPEESAAHMQNKPSLRSASGKRDTRSASGERYKRPSAVNTHSTLERRGNKSMTASGKRYGKPSAVNTRPTVEKRDNKSMTASGERRRKPSAVNTHPTVEKRDNKSMTASGERRGNTRPTLRKQGGGRPMTGRRFGNAGKNRK